MTTCDKCKFWARNGDTLEVSDSGNDWEGEELQHRKCLKVIHGNEDCSQRAMKDAPAAVLDGSGYAASLWTLPTFACNAGEER